MTGLDIGKPMAMFGSANVKVQSLIDGMATVSGPLKTPKELSGEAAFSQVDVKLQGIELKAAEPLRLGCETASPRWSRCTSLVRIRTCVRAGRHRFLG